MKVYEMTNLYVGYNEDEDFRVLVCALDASEAYEVAKGYASDSGLEGKWEIREFEESDMDTSFDADYILTGGQ